MKIQKLQKLRLINAIKYISANVSEISIVKLDKILFYFDIRTFKKTGLVPTGQWYFAESNGPAPKELNKNIIINDAKFFYNHLSFEVESTEDYFKPIKIEVKKEFNEDYFSKFDLDTLKEVVNELKDMTSEQLSDKTHESGTVWSIAKDEVGLDSIIDFLPALQSEGSISAEYVRDQLGYSTEKAVS